MYDLVNEYESIKPKGLTPLEQLFVPAFAFMKRHPEYASSPTMENRPHTLTNGKIPIVSMFDEVQYPHLVKFSREMRMVILGHGDELIAESVNRADISVEVINTAADILLQQDPKRWIVWYSLVCASGTPGINSMIHKDDIREGDFDHEITDKARRPIAKVRCPARTFAGEVRNMLPIEQLDHNAPYAVHEKLVQFVQNKFPDRVQLFNIAVLNELGNQI